MKGLCGVVLSFVGLLCCFGQENEIPSSVLVVQSKNLSDKSTDAGFSSILLPLDYDNNFFHLLDNLAIKAKLQEKSDPIVVKYIMDRKFQGNILKRIARNVNSNTSSIDPKNSTIDPRNSTVSTTESQTQPKLNFTITTSIPINGINDIATSSPQNETQSEQSHVNPASTSTPIKNNNEGTANTSNTPLIISNHTEQINASISNGNTYPVIESLDKSEKSSSNLSFLNIFSWFAITLLTFGILFLLYKRWQSNSGRRDCYQMGDMCRNNDDTPV